MPRSTRNTTLKRFYDKVYAKDERKHYTSLLLSGDRVPPAKAEVVKEISWKGKVVLDAGCGTGELPFLIAKKGAAKVIGVDYSREAIEAAKKMYALPNCEFRCEDIKKIKGTFDVITSLGTLEHVDDPLGVLMQLKKMLNPGGSLIITCPNWTNPRGYMLMMLKHLFDVKITLADIHYFTPLEFQLWAKELRMDLRWKTVEQEWGHGMKCIADFKRRLPNEAARNPKFSTDQKHIDQCIAWLESHMVPLEHDTAHGGAVGLYHFKLKTP